MSLQSNVSTDCLDGNLKQIEEWVSSADAEIMKLAEISLVFLTCNECVYACSPFVFLCTQYLLVLAMIQETYRLHGSPSRVGPQMVLLVHT